MSENHHGGFKIPQPEFFDKSKHAALTLACGGIGFISLIITLVWGYFHQQQFAFSWLFAFAFFFTIICGGIFWVLLHHVTDAGWSVVVRRQMENLAGLTPWMVLFFIPIALLASSQLYSWMTIDPAHDHLMHEKEFFLRPTLFYVRALGYFAVLSFLVWRLKGNSVAQDKTGDLKHYASMRKWAFGGLPLFAVALTFAAIDWLMALDYTWFSTMWGVYIFAGSAGSSMAVLILLVIWLQSKGYLRRTVTQEHFLIMGKLLFAFVIFWGYIGFSQYMLIWYSNIPEETSYFLRRNTESWNTLSTILVLGHFFIPFLFLSRRRMKQSPKWVSLAAIWVILMHLLDVYIIVLPILHPEGFRPHLLDILSLVAIGGLLLFLFLNALAKTSLFPPRDARIIESLKCTN